MISHCRIVRRPSVAALVAFLLATTLAACTMPPLITGPAAVTAESPVPTPIAATPAVAPTDVAGQAPCPLPPIVPPTPPAVRYRFAELDPVTGLHVTGTAQEIDLASYRLAITGKVDTLVALSYDDLRCLPKVEVRSTLVCVGTFMDTATWAGPLLVDVLALAGVQADASSLRLVGADGYRSDVSLSAVRSGQGFMAYEWEGEPLPVLHGFPVRAVFPELEGRFWVKWLVRIEVQ